MRGLKNMGQFLLGIVLEPECDLPPPSPPKKKMRVVSVDDKRRADVLSRHVRWRAIKDHEHHLKVVTLLGPLSPMGDMTRDSLLGTARAIDHWENEGGSS